MRLSFALLPLSAAVLLSACGSAPKKPQPTPPPATVVSTAKQAEANNYRISSVVLAVVKSSAFRSKRADPVASTQDK